jgi:hypothetical protein
MLIAIIADPTAPVYSSAPGTDEDAAGTPTVANFNAATAASFNQCFLIALDFESMFRAGMVKILLQQYLPLADVSRCSKLCVYRRIRPAEPGAVWRAALDRR